MNTQKIIYETGATSHAVNDLILFTDTTRELAAKRDAVYEMYVTAYEGGYTGNVSWVEFHPLFIKATQQHRKEIPNSQVKLSKRGWKNTVLYTQIVLQIGNQNTVINKFVFHMLGQL